MLIWDRSVLRVSFFFFLLRVFGVNFTLNFTHADSRVLAPFMNLQVSTWSLLLVQSSAIGDGDVFGDAGCSGERTLIDGGPPWLWFVICAGSSTRCLMWWGFMTWYWRYLESWLSFIRWSFMAPVWFAVCLLGVSGHHMRHLVVALSFWTTIYEIRCSSCKLWAR